jgi:hypothetical protein
MFSLFIYPIYPNFNFQLSNFFFKFRAINVFEFSDFFRKIIKKNNVALNSIWVAYDWIIVDDLKT